MLTCTFAGHAEVYAHIGDKLSEIIENCLKDTDQAIFYVGGRGEFDAMAASAVRAAKAGTRIRRFTSILWSHT